MEYNTNTLCSICISSGRKIIPISGSVYERCFSQIISNLPIDAKTLESLSLCWECEAKIKNIEKFKQQVQFSYVLLRNHIELELHPSKSTLTTTEVTNIDYTNHNDTQTDQLYTDTEQPIDYSSDNISLPNLSKNKTKKKKVKKRKKKTPKTSNETEVDENIQTDTQIDSENFQNSMINKEICSIVELNMAEVIEERSKMQNSDDYTNAMFKCTNCIITFLNEDDLKEHVQKKHELHASKHKCSICTCALSSEVSLNYHWKRHVTRYECNTCGERSVHKRTAMKHYELTHCYAETYDLKEKLNKTDGSDDINGKGLNDIDGVETDNGYGCKICDKVFRWKTSLRKHLEMHEIESGQKRRPYCAPCGLSFTTTSNLQRHAKTSSKHQIKLKLRKLKETDPEKRKDHKKEIDNIKSSVITSKVLYSCPQCERTFQWRGNMLRHLHTHAARASGELVCKPCNRKFSSHATYKQHLQISKKHVSENDFKHMCSDCGKRFPNKWKLKEHVNWEHLKNYIHTCVDCQKVFKCNTSLYLHRQMAHKDNECLCDLCGKSFSNKTKLTSHMAALHTTEAPYKCTSCSARFTWQSCLSRHIRRLHRNALNKTKLTSHMAALHTTEAPYKCTSCSARFTWQSCLSRHIRRLHRNALVNK